MTINGDGLVQKRRLSDRERFDVLALADICNSDEGLEIKLNIGSPPDDAAAGGNDFLYYVDGGETLAGYCALDAGRAIELCGMVHPAHRRRGLGRLLLDAASAEGRRRGVDSLLLICERASRSGQAFVKTTGAQYRSAELRMRLDLAAFRARPYDGARLTLRQAGPEHVEPLTRILAASFNDPEDATRARVQHDLPAPGGWFVLARLAGEPVGTLRVVDMDRTANIYAFGLLPAYRGRGLGRRMLEATLEALRQDGYTSAGLEVETENANAVALYRSCGFVETTTYEYYALDLPHLS